LLSNLLFELLNLIKSSNKVLLEVALDVIRYFLHSIVEVVNFASVELILNEVCELLVVVFAIFGISRTLSLGVRAVELGLKPKQLCGSSSLISRSRVVSLRVKR
jgi:hypothetical protein